MKYTKFIAIILSIFLFACDSKPKVIEAEQAGESNAPIFQDGAASTAAPTQDINNQEHKVVVQEVLNTDKYSYLRVKEGEQETWIAITKRDIKVGATAYYRGGLMKKNFQSKEFNRVFETVYLVGDFREEGADQAQAMPTGGGIPPKTEMLEAPKNVKPAPGAIKISELVANKTKYNGKIIKVTGKVVKVNPMIMGRNWLHLKDGSGKDLELTVTTNETVQLGEMVTMEGTLNLNKDFGAGYKYDYIMEGAKKSN